MKQMEIIYPHIEKAILVGYELRGSAPLLSLHDSLDELAQLAETAGIKVVGRATQVLNNISPGTLIGKGKIDEVREQLTMTDAKTVIFDDELSPRHQRELAKIFGDEIKLLDRSALILDIFAQHAATREGALQVELAQYEYRLPRLTRQWTHLARQAGGGGARGGSGGVGLRGPGETQLEVDRREITRKITKLKADIERVRQHRSRHRNQRKKTGIPVVAVVGYTNAGKSTLLNALTDANVYAADQLFATLDPTTRRIELPSKRHILFTDTVGFIQKLPTTLVAAFRATLEEITEADLILHVADVAHPNVLAHIESVTDTLAEIDIPDIPEILVWNKIDALDGATIPELDEDTSFDAVVEVSAKQAQGLDVLLTTLEQVLSDSMLRVTLKVPYEQGGIIAQIFEMTNVQNQEHTPEGVIIDVRLPPYRYELFSEFVIS